MITRDIEKYELETDTELKLAKVTPNQMAEKFLEKNSHLGASVNDYFEVFRRLKVEITKSGENKHSQALIESAEVHMNNGAKNLKKRIAEDIKKYGLKTDTERKLATVTPKEMADEFIQKNPALGASVDDYFEVYRTLKQEKFGMKFHFSKRT